MFKFVLLIAVLFAGAACYYPCTKCFTDLGPFKCSMLQQVTTCLRNEVNCEVLIRDIQDGCSDNYASFYYIESGGGVDVYNSYMGIGDRSNWNVPGHCLHDFCTDFIRSDLMDLWESLPIDKIDFSFGDRETGTSRALSFDGRNSTKTNWFTAERLVYSPWNDLTKDNSYYFSIEGYAGVRRFYIAKKHCVCGSDDGWLSVVEGERWCDYAKADSYPKILFSRLAGATRWSREYVDGDYILLSIKLMQ